jgi:molybdopterin molybdotransferase
MITRQEALALIGNLPAIQETETLPLEACVGRILADDVAAKLTHPPAAMSAMDGYAVSFSGTLGDAPLQVIGEAAAGAPFDGVVSHGQCVRLFTGSVIPRGCDHVIIQEHVRRQANTVWVEAPQASPRNIRPAGIDFHEGQVLLEAGLPLRPVHLSIAAAANHAAMNVRRRPRVALLTNGDELKPPGSGLEPGQIISSNEYALMALIRGWGAEAFNLGTAADDPSDIRQRVENAGNPDVFVPIGGASVGDHDHMKDVFLNLGFETVFSKIAIKPGKPTWHARRNHQSVLGLPGNPASALVCAHLFLKPLLSALQLRPADELWARGVLSNSLPANGPREAFLRATLVATGGASPSIVPASDQDSSLLSPFASANFLVHRPANAPASPAGDNVDGVRLN